MTPAGGGPPRQLAPEFFRAHPATVAPRLIGVTLLVGGVGGVIVETEAYDAADPASHSFRGPTPRNAPMFGPNGHAYIYRIYGLHWCLNFSCGDPGGAVLIRALEPVEGLDAMQARRGMANPRQLCAGPGRLAQALALDGTHNGVSLFSPPFRLLDATPGFPVLNGPRIGISAGVDTPWRFALAGSRYLSRPMRP